MSLPILHVPDEHLVADGCRETLWTDFRGEEVTLERAGTHTPMPRGYTGRLDYMARLYRGGLRPATVPRLRALGPLGPLTSALTRPPGYVYGVGHRWRPQWCPWPLISDDRPLAHPWCVELQRPVESWMRASMDRVQTISRTVVASHELLRGWPRW